MTTPEEIDPHSKRNGANDLKSEKGGPKQGPLEWKKSDAPDGGLAAWFVVLGSWCVLFCSFGWINSKIGPERSYRKSELYAQ